MALILWAQGGLSRARCSWRTAMTKRIMAKKETARTSRNAQLWLGEALNVLRDEGVEKVSIEYLAKRLGITKGTFYYIFKDRRELLDALLEYYYEAYTQRYVELANSLEGTPLQRFHALLDRSIHEGITDLDKAFRIWALKDEKAAALFKRIDEARYQMIKTFFTDHGFDEMETRVRSEVFLYYYIGALLFDDRETPNDEYLFYAKRVSEILFAPTPKA